MKVLLAVDGSAYTKRMLAYLAAHDELLGNRPEYTVLTVVPDIPPHAAQFLSSANIDAYYRTEGDEVLNPVKAFITMQGWKATFRTELGHPSTIIANAATEGKFDLLVLGSHGHTLLGGLVLGSVATSVLSHCKVPLLLVR